MATFEETIFFVQFFFFIALFLLKLYNVLSNGELYGWKETIITYILNSILFGVGFFTAILNYSSNLTIQMLKLQTPLFIMYTLFLFIELLFLIQTKVAGRQKNNYNAREYYLAK